MVDPQNPSGFPYEAARQIQSGNGEKKHSFKFYWYVFRFSAIILLFPFVRYTGCLATQGDRDQALQLETAFHQYMQKGDTDGTYNTTDAVFQNAVPRARHAAYMAWIAREFGTPVDCTQRNTGVKYGLGSKRVRSQCVTSFSSGNTGVETFIWTETNGQYLLSHYDIKHE